MIFPKTVPHAVMSYPPQVRRPKRDNFDASFPFQLRLEDCEIAMQDVYDRPFLKTHLTPRTLFGHPRRKQIDPTHA